MVAALLAAAPGSVRAEEAATAPDRSALRAPLAAKSLLLDVVPAGPRLVAVGSQGVVVTSDDDGQTWTQAQAPVSSMLTAVSFADATRGWAVGHDGVVLQTSDGGRTWTRDHTPAVPEDSFLTVLALSAEHVLAAGAYGLMYATNDGGATWTREHPLEEDLHINRLTRGASGRVYLAGESGTLAVSADAGATWTPLTSPYEGSFYGLHELASGRLLAHGLRGHVLVSDDDGATWSETDLPPGVLLMTATETAPGTIVIGGLGGHVFISRDNGTTFAAKQPAELTGSTEVVATAGGQLVFVGETGAHRLAVP